MGKPARPHAAAPGQSVPVEIKSVPDPGAIEIVFLENPRWIPTHYHAGASRYCSGDDQCPAAVHRTRLTWKGYAAALEWRPPPWSDWGPTVFEVTENLGELLKDRTLRGTMWSIFRHQGRYGKREVTCKFSEDRSDFLWPDPFDVVPALVRVYGRRDFVFSAENGVAGRLFVASVLAGAPLSQNIDAATGKYDRAKLPPEHQKMREELLNGMRPSANGKGAPRGK